MIFFSLTGFDRVCGVVLYQDLPLTDKKRRLFKENILSGYRLSLRFRKNNKKYGSINVDSSLDRGCVYDPCTRDSGGSLHCITTMFTRNIGQEQPFFSGATTIITNRFPFLMLKVSTFSLQQCRFSFQLDVCSDIGCGLVLSQVCPIVWGLSLEVALLDWTHL